MTPLKGIIITLSASILFGLLGGAAGYMLGSIAPEYYRLVFRISPEITTDVPRLGFVLGVTQGLVAGTLVGLVIVASVAWYNSRAAAFKPDGQGT